MSASFSPAWVTGTGVISCIGEGSNSLYQAVYEGKSGLERGLGFVPAEVIESLQSRFPELSGEGRAALIGAGAVHQAMQKAGWKTLGPDDLIILATTVGRMELWENKFLDFYRRGETDPLSMESALQNQPLNRLGEALKRFFQMDTPVLTISSACSAATQAIGLAALSIQQGRARRCLVGGVETLCELTTSGFKSLQLLTEEGCAPFDQNRKGINLSEAAAFLCLEAKPQPPADSSPQALISGFGMSTDAFHMAAPEPMGRGTLSSLRLALESARLTPGDIQWVHAHGTGTQANDCAEAAAITELFKEFESPAVSSTKRVHGHALGASGALEAVLCIEALCNQMILPTLGLQTPDPLIQISHVKKAYPAAITHILKNTLGFGGNNASVVISRSTWSRGD